MGYCTLAEVKALVGAELATDDALLTTLIDRATQLVDTHTRRTFVAQAQTLYYTPYVHTDGLDLLLGSDLLTVTTLTNGDGIVVDAEDYTLLPRNTLPKTRIRLTEESELVWTYEDSPEGAISLEATWGYSTTPPEDVVQATARLTLWLYRQREAPFGKIGNTITGEYEVPVALPNDVVAMLAPYRRPVSPYRRIPWGGL